MAERLDRLLRADIWVAYQYMEIGAVLGGAPHQRGLSHAGTALDPERRTGKLEFERSSDKAAKIIDHSRLANEFAETLRSSSGHRTPAWSTHKEQHVVEMPLPSRVRWVRLFHISLFTIKRLARARSGIFSDSILRRLIQSTLDVLTHCLRRVSHLAGSLTQGRPFEETERHSLAVAQG